MPIDNLVTISGGSYANIKKALVQWIHLYSKDMTPDYVFELHKNGRGNHVIVADPRLDNDRFYFLVNYLNYPENIDYKVKIRGYTVGRNNNVLKDKRLLIYIPEEDHDYDNVFVVTTENITYKVDFGGAIISVETKIAFQQPDNFNLDNPEIIKPKKELLSEESIAESTGTIRKRFRIISLSALIVYVACLLVLEYDFKLFVKGIIFFGIGLATWFLGDYKMLQSPMYYFYSLLMSLLYIGITLFLIEGCVECDFDTIRFPMFYPLLLLLIQKPLRFLFKASLKREPVVDRPPPTFWDGVYTITLFLVPIYLASQID